MLAVLYRFIHFRYLQSVVGCMLCSLFFSLQLANVGAAGQEQMRPGVNNLAVPAPPPVATSTYFGGAGNDEIKDVAFASDGIIVIGTLDGAIPLSAGAVRRSPLGSGGVSGVRGFAAKFALDGKSLIWYADFPVNTILPAQLALDSANNLYLTGIAYSGFQALIGGFSPFQAAPNGTNDPFVAKISADGNSLLGGTFQTGDDDSSLANCQIALAAGNQPIVSGLNGNAGFIARFSADGKSRVFSTAISNTGNPNTFVFDIAVNPVSDYSYATGYFQQTSVLKTPYLIAFDAAGKEVWRDYSIVVASQGADSQGRALTVSPDGLSVFAAFTADGGNTVLAYDPKTPGTTTTPKLSGAYQNSYGSGGGPSVSFIGRYAASDGSLQDATFLHATLSSGKTNSTNVAALTVDTAGQVYLTGTTAAGLQLSSGALRTDYTAYEGFLVILDAAMSSLSYSTHLGSSGDESGATIAVNSSQTVVAGRTSGIDFSTFSPFQATSGGTNDGWLAIFGKPTDVTATPTYFHNLTPARLYSSVVASGGAGPLALNQARTIQASGKVAIPTSATSILANLTVLNTTAGGYLTAYPSGGKAPVASSLNWFGAGQQIGNFAFIALDSNGKFDVILGGPAGGSADVIIDVVGYLDNNAAGGGIYQALAAAVNPRLYDSRNNGSGIFGGDGVLSAGTKRDIQVTGGNSGVPAGALAVVVNITAVQSVLGGYLTLYPQNLTTAPGVASVNWRITTSDGAIVGPSDIGNMALVPLSPDGKLSLLAGGAPGSSAHATLDVMGYIAASGTSGRYTALTPNRLYDSRPNTPTTLGGTASEKPLSGNTNRSVQVTGYLGVPNGATAVVVRVTRVRVLDANGAPLTGGGFLAMFAGSNWPGNASVNFTSNPLNQVLGNLAIVPLAPDGKLTVRAGGTTSDFVLDLLGFIQ